MDEFNNYEQNNYNGQIPQDSAQQPNPQQYQQPQYGQPNSQQYQQPQYGQPDSQQYQQPQYNQPESQQYQQPFQPNYPNPHHYQQEYNPQTEPGKGMAIASMVLGICSIALSCCFGFITAILAVVFGIISISQTNKAGLKINTMAIVGLSLGVFALVLSIILTCTMDFSFHPYFFR